MTRKGAGFESLTAQPEDQVSGRFRLMTPSTGAT
jgi:hypothetical protein